MSDLAQRLAEARALPPATPSDDHIEALIHGARRRGKRRTRNRAMLGTLMLLIAVGTGYYRLHARPTMTFADGSSADVLEPGTQLAVTESSTARVEVAVARGRSRFEVTHDSRRVFRVTAGAAKVEVIGTRFTVEHERDQVCVAVERGRVRLRSPNGQERYLDAGQEATVPDHVTTAAAQPQQEPQQRVTPEPGAKPEIEPAPEAQLAPNAEVGAELGVVAPTAPVRSMWRAAAEKGNYSKAYSQLHAAGKQAVRDLPEELMLAADVARWSHHATAAVPLLERVLRDHKKDPRAQLAAFTLGRVYLEELGRPRDAALAFERALALDHKGPLAEDALAHEVEAWSRTADNERARTRAEQYVRLYPAGPHLAAVRRFGKLD